MLPSSAASLVGASEVVTQLVAHAHQIELHGEALLEAVAPVDVDGVDRVERLLGGADDSAVLGRDVGGQPERQVVELVAGDDAVDRAELDEVGGRDGPGGEVESAHEVL